MKHLESFTGSGAIADKATTSEKLEDCSERELPNTRQRYGGMTPTLKSRPIRRDPATHDEAEILATVDNRVSRELLESWFTGPQSINKCNDMSTPYSVLRHRLAKVIDHSGRAQAGEPDGRAIITPASNTGDDISVINNWHADQQAISAPAGNDPS
nr:unnamed protein product [Spirometra erinaceieuropaei]